MKKNLHKKVFQGFCKVSEDIFLSIHFIIVIFFFIIVAVALIIIIVVIIIISFLYSFQPLHRHFLVRYLDSNCFTWSQRLK